MSYEQTYYIFHCHIRRLYDEAIILYICYLYFFDLHMVQLYIFLWLTDGPVIYISLTYRWSSYIYFSDLQMVQLYIFLWLTDGPVIYISLTYRWSRTARTSWAVGMQYVPTPDTRGSMCVTMRQGKCLFMVFMTMHSMYTSYNKGSVLFCIAIMSSWFSDFIIGGISYVRCT